MSIPAMSYGVGVGSAQDSDGEFNEQWVFDSQSANDVAYSASTNTVIAATDSGIYTIDEETGESSLLHTEHLNTPRYVATHNGIAYSADGGEIIAYDMGSDTVLWSNNDYQVNVGLDVDTDGRYVFFGDSDGVRGLNVDSGASGWQYNVGEGVSAFEAGVDNVYVGYSSGGTPARAISIQSESLVWEITESQDGFYSSVDYYDGHTDLASGSGPDNVVFERIVDGTIIDTYVNETDANALHSMTGGTTAIGIGTTVAIYEGETNSISETLSLNNTVSGMAGDRSSSLFVLSNDAITSYGVSAFLTPPTTGQVTNPDGGPIENATVSFNNTETGSNETVLTDSNGSFSVNIENGTYDIEVRHSQYVTHTETRMITAGDDLTFELSPAGVRIVTGERMDPNESMSFKAEYWTGDDWINVTDDSANLTVTSGNTSVITVDQDRAKLFSQPNVTSTVNVTATYTQDGETYNYSAEIVVATLSIDNLDILPEAYWPTTILRDSTLQWVGMGLLMGLAFARITGNPWAGLGTAEFVLSFGWMIGFVTAGVMLASLFYVAAASIMIADVYRPRR